MLMYNVILKFQKIFGNSIYAFELTVTSPSTRDTFLLGKGQLARYEICEKENNVNDSSMF